MTAEKLMNAIGGISDRHIAEFANVKPVGMKSRLLKFVSVAACLCFIAIGTVFFMKNSAAPHGGGSDIDAPRPAETVWGMGLGDMEWKDYAKLAEKGSVIITDELQIMMERSDNEEDVFAILVEEMTGGTEEEVYSTFVKPSGVEEEYMEKGVIYATAEQINSFVCPSELALVLYLYKEPYREVIVDEEYLKTVGDEKIKVYVSLVCDINALFDEHEELALFDEDDEDDFQKLRRLRIDILAEEGDRIIDGLISDYEITCEILGRASLLSSFTAELEPELIAELLADERVGFIIKESEIPLLDQ